VVWSQGRGIRRRVVRGEAVVRPVVDLYQLRGLRGGFGGWEGYWMRGKGEGEI